MVHLVKAKFIRLRSNALARDTATMSAGHFLRLLIQAVYFIAIARTLGTSQYGQFVAISAVVGITTPFAGVGSASILLKNASRDRALLPLYWGNGIIVTLISGALFTIVLILLGSRFVGPNLTLAIFCFSISELILARIVELASFAWTAIGRMRETALLNVYVSLSRLFAILILSAFKHHPNVQDWCVAILVGSIACCIYSTWALRAITTISFDLPRIRKEFAEGCSFAIGSSAATVYNDIDKSMLAKMSSLQATGIYGAAYRIIDVSMAPMKAMTASSYAEFFRRGKIGPKATAEYAYKLIRSSSMFGLLIWISLILCAPLLPLVLGRGFSQSVEALRWLAVIPLLRSFHFFLGDALSGAGLNATRTTVQVVVAAINFALNLYFIAHWTWRGAAWTSVMCDLMLVFGFALALEWTKRHPRTPVAAEPPLVEAL